MWQTGNRDRQEAASIYRVGRKNIQSVMRPSHRFTTGSHREHYFVSSCLLSFPAPSFFIYLFLFSYPLPTPSAYPRRFISSFTVGLVPPFSRFCMTATEPIYLPIQSLFTHSPSTPDSTRHFT